MPQAVRPISSQAETKVKHLPFARSKVFHQVGERFLAFVVGADRGAFVVGHRLGKLEVAVVVEDGVQGNRSAGSRLQMRQVLEAAAGS